MHDSHNLSRYVVNGRSLLLFPGVCLRGHGRGLRSGNTVMISGLHASGARGDVCQVWAADAAVDYVIVSSAPVTPASPDWLQFRGLSMFPWSILASCLHPYAYLTLRALVRSMVRPCCARQKVMIFCSSFAQLHILSASVSDVDVVCVDGPAHQIMAALGWCAHMPVLDGLQTRFFEASLGNIAADCFAPMVVSLQFVRECCLSRTESLSQEDVLQGSHIDGREGRVPSFPIHELCFSRENSMLEHMTLNTAIALEAVKHEQVISGFVFDWFNRGALHRNFDHKLWLVWRLVSLPDVRIFWFDE
jgi:hypothetical protein